MAQAKPAPRDADELHDTLLSLVAVAIDPAWTTWSEALVAARRIGFVDAPSGRLAFAAEHARAIDVLYPGRTTVAPLSLEGPSPSLEEAAVANVRGHAEIAGPFTETILARALGLDEADVRIAVARLEGQGHVLRGAFTGADKKEVCDRRLLARIHRQTLDRLRSEIEPVSAQDFMRYLFERHQLSPTARRGGTAGLRAALELLEGCELPAAEWETSALARRVAGYASDWLDELCLSGEVTWARLTPGKGARDVVGSTSRATPIAIARRTELGALIEAVRGATDPEPPTAEAPAAVLEVLRKRGALFLHDIASATRLSRHALADALWDLVGRGFVTSDGLQPLRDLLSDGKAAKRSGRATQGRFALVERSIDAPFAAEALAELVAERLLQRYGVALRELYVRESFTVPWRDVARALRRREARGLVRGGLFVAGFIGEQYALPEAVDGLRRTRRRERTGEIVTIGASDPLNLIGVVLPLPPSARPTRSEEVTFVDGLYVEPHRASAENLPILEASA